MEQWEPNPHWDEEFLRNRAMLYSAVDHPRKAEAIRDLRKFKAQQPEGFSRPEEPAP